MERLAHAASRWPVLGIVTLLLAVDAVLFLPAMSWVVPDAPEVEGMPTITHLQLSWTGERFAGYLAEWSGEACDPVPGGAGPCVWPVEAGDREPPPVTDGPAGLRRATLLLDMVFPVLYALFAIGLGTRLWSLLDRNRRWLRPVVAAAAVAAVCDLTENTIHLWLLGGIDTWAEAAEASYPTAAVAAASGFATVKYTLLLVLAGTAVVTVIRRGAAAVRRRAPGGAAA